MRRSLCCVIAVLIWAMNAYADGVYIYRAKPPAIPSQRAIIVYKDGIERLQVESMVQSEGDSLAWILPVPATPTDIKEVSPGFLKTLALNVGPRIVGKESLWQSYGVAKTSAVIITIWALVFLIRAPGRRAVVPSVLIVAVACGVVAFLGIFLFTMRGAEVPHVVEGVRVEKASVVGNYEVAVLDAPDALALDTWLTQNDFVALPTAGQAIATDYIKKGWRFVAAKLRTEAGRLLCPHPLELAFPAKHPVYPMRLTALADCDVYVELYVFADRAAENELLVQQVVKTLVETKPERWMGRSFPVKPGHVRWNAFEHTDAPKYAWEGCTLTRLDGTLSPAQMDNDIELSMVPPVPVRRVYYSFEARTRFARTCGLGAWALVLTVATIAATFRKTPRLRRKAMALSGATAGFAALVVGFACWIVLPAKDAVALFPRHGDEAKHLMYDHDAGWVTGDIVDTHPGFEKLPPSEMAAIVRAYFTYTPVFNSLTGEPILLEESPGNILVENDDKGVVLKLHEWHGGTHTWNAESILDRSYRDPSRTHFPLNNGDLSALEKYFDELAREPLSRWDVPIVPTEIVYAVARDPQRLAGPPMKIVERYCAGQKVPASTVELAVGCLGLATKTAPPQDLTNREALKAFLDQVESRLQPQAATPTPGE